MGDGIATYNTIAAIKTRQIQMFFKA